MDVSDIDQRKHDYDLGFVAGKEHATPSPETRENLSLMKHEVADLRKELTTSLNYIKVAVEDGFKATNTKLEYTNGKVAELMSYKLRMEGGAAVIKGIWGAIGMYIISATIGLFYMWVSFQQMSAKLDNIDVVIRETVRSEVYGLVLEEVKK